MAANTSTNAQLMAQLVQLSNWQIANTANGLQLTRGSASYLIQSSAGVREVKSQTTLYKK